MRYEVHAGRIATWALEAHVVDHCNLRCEQCCTLSPGLPRAFADPSKLEHDLKLAARVLAPSVFKLTGGEPSLHPRLVECVEAARASAIAPTLSMTTNGLLGRQLPTEVFRLLDRITLSVYASAPVQPKTIAYLESQCRAHDVLLTVKPIGIFQRMTPRVEGDWEHARGVFSGCWLKVRCHTLHGGRFFPCTRPPHLGAWLASNGTGGYDAGRDGVDLDTDAATFVGRAMERLESDEPLDACRHCLGGTGDWIAHRQARR